MVANSSFVKMKSLTLGYTFNLKPTRIRVFLSGEKLRKYFPRSYTPFQIENTIFKLLDAWQKKRQRDQSR